MTKSELIAKIEELEQMIFVYSDRDRVRLAQLEKEKRMYEFELLILMSEEPRNVA